MSPWKLKTTRGSRKVQNMKKMFILGLALVAACAAYATPTLTGPTGGFELPTADVAVKSVTVAMDQATNFDGPAYPNTRAVCSVLPGLEVSGMYEQFKAGEGKDSTWNASAKYQLPVDTGKLKLAVGAGYGEAYGTDHLWNAYVAATTPLCGTKATANIGYAKNVGIDRSGISAGLAVEKSLNEKTAVGAELIFGDKTGIFTEVFPGSVHANIYVSHSISDGLSARLGFAGIGQDETSLYVGGSYKFNL